MGRLYADEDFHDGVVERLRRLGHDVITVQEALRSRGSDAQGRVVLSFKRRHFERLHRTNQAHEGIISCTRDPNLDALADRIHQLVST